MLNHCGFIHLQKSEILGPRSPYATKTIGAFSDSPIWASIIDFWFK